MENLKGYYLEVESLALEPKPLLDGREIMDILKIKPSKLIGEILENIKLSQLSGELQTKEEAIEFIKNYKNKADKPV